MIIKTPTKFFLVSGSSEGFSLLNSFDCALLKSGIGDTNLVKMSSILPPKCKRITPIKIPQGSLLPVAYASMSSDVKGEVISSAVAIGIPADSKQAGLIMEYSAKDDQWVVEEKVRTMAQKGMEFRHREIKEIISISASIRITTVGASFAGVVLWG